MLISDKTHHPIRVIFVISLPLLLTSSLVLFSTASAPNMHMQTSNKYAVIFDAGSSGSRVHVFCFDKDLDLVHIGEELELFMQGILNPRHHKVWIASKGSGSSLKNGRLSLRDVNMGLRLMGKEEKVKPGLSAYAADPKAAANSLIPLLEKAEEVVPQNMRKNTPVKVGATAGLRQLGGDASERILQAVKDLLKVKSSLKTNDDSVTVLDGTQEGAYQWMTINYLLKNLGKNYSSTVGVVDLGGGSVQMAYAISEADAANAPTTTKGEDLYVKEMFLKGTKYYLYVHSYLNYGLQAARAQILGVTKNAHNPCILAGYNGVYTYGGINYKVSAPSSGSNMNKCRNEALKALKVNETTCTHSKCTFGGVWNGGGGDGQKHLFVASFFFDRAAEAGFINASQPVAKVRPRDFHMAAKRACQITLQDAKSIYPNVDSANLPYLCMDLVYQYTLLVDGFDLQPRKHITLVKQVEYQNSLVEAAWPLGSAIEAVSAAV
ncbi:hypothetical protein M8C21_007813 [Ambrosia artemisiifolia]|uniref:Apyrase n=1 Tax=Ambrosia artemisiifolia TaxID=4212 RepID=A0AAD5G8S0_AMBAR|nr:hypothetical protein M8C21_007813 [Ambrosia artemisiifolia]